jgi:hypothetical protein
MKTTIKITDFNFTFAGYGHYKVSYTSPVTRKQWSKTISDMSIIDATKNAESPKIKDLKELKLIVKN